jgi:putative DNA primase/helicase
MDSVSSNSATATVSSNKSLQNTLLHKHMDYFVERGILLIWALANARSVTAKEATELLGYPVKSDGIWFEGANGVGQFRPDTRWKDKKGKLVGKFLSPLQTVCEVDIFIPNHPTDPSYWETENLKKACYHINDHPHIVTTEGAAKAIAGCAKGLPTVAVSGVENGLTGQKNDPEGKRFLVPTLRKLAEAGLGFIAAYDADVATNPSVATAERTLATQLGKFKVPVRTITGKWAKEIEGKDTKGMDDFIQHRGIEKFRAILSKAKLFDEAESQRETLDKGDKKKGKQLPPPSEVAAEIAETYRNKLAWESEYQLWRRYHAKHDGVWDIETVETVKGLIDAHICSKGLPGFSAGYISSIATLLQSRLEVRDWNEQAGLIPLRDGVLDQVTQELKPHAPGYRFTWQLPFKWADRSVGCEPIEKFLLRITGNQAIANVLLAFLNCIVTRQSKYQRYLELKGGGGTGKSTYMGLARALAGEENTVSSQLKHLENNQFETAKFYGKLLGLFPDSERWQGEVSVLKQMTGQDPIRYERKGVQQCRDFVFGGMVILSANEAPESRDLTSGQERRKLTIELDIKVPEYEDVELIEQFKPFLPGLLKRVLDIPREEVTRLIKHTDRQVPELAQVKWKQLCETNPIAGWLDEKAVIDPDAKGYIGLGDIDEAGRWLYANFCKHQQDSGVKNSIPMKRFSNNLRDLLKNQMKVAITEGRDRNGSFIQGIGLRCNLDPTGEVYPCPVTKKPFCDGFVMDCDGSVTVESLTDVEFDGYDGFSENSKEAEKSQSESSSTPSPDKSCGIDGEKKPSHPSNPTSASIPAVTKPPQEPRNPSRPETHANERRGKNLANEMREAIAEGDREKAKEVMRLFEASTLQVRGFFNRNLTPHEKNAASLLLKYGFMKGTQVEYVGTDGDLKEQYGDMVLVIDSHNNHKRPLIACLKPDGSFTTWLKPEDLRRL